MSYHQPPELAQTGNDVTHEEIHLRNYDLETAHQVWINIVTDGTQVCETTRRLRPGEAHSIGDAVPPGEYDVEIGIDGLRRKVKHCRIGDAPERTAVIEMGNGVVSITEGLR